MTTANKAMDSGQILQNLGRKNVNMFPSLFSDNMYDIYVISCLMCVSQKKCFAAFWCGNLHSPAWKCSASHTATNHGLTSVTSHCPRHSLESYTLLIVNIQQGITSSLFSCAEKSRLTSKLKQSVSCHWKFDQVFLHFSSSDYIANKYQKQKTVLAAKSLI